MALKINAASGSSKGILTVDAQTLAGEKTFTSKIVPNTQGVIGADRNNSATNASLWTTTIPIASKGCYFISSIADYNGWPNAIASFNLYAFSSHYGTVTQTALHSTSGSITGISMTFGVSGGYLTVQVGYSSNITCLVTVYGTAY